MSDHNKYINDPPTPTDVISRSRDGISVRQILSALFNFVGGFAGLIACGLVVWRGGAIEEKVLANDRRLDRLEISGSPALAAHVQMDDMRVADIRGQLKTQAEQLTAAVDLKVEVRVLGTKMETRLDAVTERLKSLEGAVRDAAANTKGN